MAKQNILLGTLPNDGTGDPIRTAFTKVNENFTELYNEKIENSITDIQENDILVYNGEVWVNQPFPTIPSDINQLTDTDGLLNQGNANTGDVTFSGVQIIGAPRPETGHFLSIPTNYDQTAPSLNQATSIQLNPQYPGLNDIVVGDTITFNDNTTTTVIASYLWEQDNFWVVQWENTITKNSADVWPLTIVSQNWKPWEQPALILKADDTANYGIEIFNSIDNDTHLKPLNRDRGISLGFAYGLGSHVRIEGSNGQWGNGDGDRVGILASDGLGQSAEWKFDKDGNISLPNGGKLGLEGMGWTGLNNGTTETPVTVAYRSNTGVWHSAITFSGGNDTDGEGSISLYTYNVNTQTNYQWSFDANGNTTLPGAIIKSTITENDTSALNLNKSIHKLSEGNYTLADGVEGQIMYIVPQSNVSNVSNVSIYVAHGRHASNSFTNNLLFPFRQTLSGDYQDVIDSSLCTLIFTDGAWQQSGGLWD